MKNSFGDEARLRHILDAISEIESYTYNTDLDEFIAHSMTKYATVKQLEIIGEAANHISAEVKEKYSDTKWSEIVGLRNILIHQYFGIDEQVVWAIVTKDVPPLKIQIKQILDDIKSK